MAVTISSRAFNQDAAGAKRAANQGAGRSATLHLPDPQPFRDGLIAATALVHNLLVVSRNLADFKSSGVRLLNPWQERRAA